MSGAEVIPVLGLAVKVAQAGAHIISTANDVNQRRQRIDNTLDQYRERLNRRANDLGQYQARLELRVNNHQPYTADEQEEVRKAYDDANRVLLDAIAALSDTEQLRIDIAGTSGIWTRLFLRQHDTEALLSEGRNLDDELKELDRKLDHLRL
jgi:hypothetical protein